jgi:hypothetical protein
MTQLLTIPSLESSASGGRSIFARLNSTFEIGLPSTPFCGGTAGAVDHVGRHVDADRLTGRSDLLGSEEHVQATAGAQIDHHFTYFQVSGRDRLPHDRSIFAAAGIEVSSVAV